MNGHRHILRRDGVSQARRLLEALVPAYFKVDERGPESLLAYANALAEHINYYNAGNRIDGDWQDFFPLPDEGLLALFGDLAGIDGKTTPNLALFIAFLRLFGQGQADLNLFTARHLEFYYKEVLGLERRPRQADRVFVVFELAKNLAEHRIIGGTLLDAGKDASGKPRRYATEKEIVINKAGIESLKSIFVDPADEFKLYAAAQADSADGQGAPFDDAPLWPAFGESQGSLPEGRKNMMPVSLGLAVAGPILHMAEGQRSLTVRIDSLPVDTDTPASRNYRQLFQVSFTGAEGWTGPLAVDARLLTDQEQFSTSGAQTTVFRTASEVNFSQGQIIVLETTQLINRDTGQVNTELRTVTYNLNNVFLGESFINTVTPITESQKFPPPDSISYTKKLFALVDIPPSYSPVAPYQEDIHQEHFNTAHPVMKLTLNRDASFYPYKELSYLQLGKVSVKATVRDITDVTVQNNQSLLDAGGPFTPFGAVPAVGSTFYLGHPEIFKKNIQNIFVDIDWQDAPASFNDYYGGYDVSALNNESFKMSAAALAGRTWHELTPASGFLGLFENPDATETNAIQLSANLGFPKMESLEAVGKFDNSTATGFLRFRFEGVLNGGVPVDGLSAFGHKEYPKLYASVAIFNATHPDDTPLAFPNEPYTPTIDSIRLGYDAQAEFIPGTTTGSGKVFHLEPFGQYEPGDAAPFIFPEFSSEGYFFIGLKDFSPPRNLSILLQVAEGTQSQQGLSAAPEVSWSYLAGSQWIALNKLALLSDSTEHLKTTGIIEFSIGRNASMAHTRMPEGLHWLRGQVVQNTGGVNRLVRLLTQAVTAEAVLPVEEPGGEAELALAPDTIKKLVQKDAAVKGVSQPFASFGGRDIEADDSYYQRISERLRHKNRAIGLYDYERAALEAFPSIYKVKCLQNTLSTAAPFDIAPGRVTLVVISNLRNKYAVNPLEPKASSIELSRIKAHLEALVSGFVGIEVENPIYEKLLVEADVGFMPGYDPGFYGNQLNEDIKRFLSPWAYEEGQDIIFGGKVFRSDILAFIEKREYVDFVNNFKLYHILDSSRITDSDSLFEDEYTALADSAFIIGNAAISSTFVVGRPSEVVVASTPASILISAPSHRIRVLNTGEYECEGGFEQTGIGFMFVGINFEVGPDT